MNKRLRGAVVVMVGACALAGLTPAITNAAITQTYIGPQKCSYRYTNILTGAFYDGAAEFQIVRWDNPRVSTRVFQLNVKDNDHRIAEIQTQEFDATTGRAMGLPWSLSKNSDNFYIQDNL